MSAGRLRVRAGLRDPHQWWLWLSGLVGSRYDGLTHFDVVAPGVLMRSGQPRVRDLRQIREQHGLRTIVCARGGTRHPLRGRWFRKERRFCEAAGVRLLHMPFSDKAAPPADVFDRFIAVLRDPACHPVLVHCEQGFHRTGVLCAAYRIACEGWAVERALGELESLGFEMKREKRRPLLDALRAWAGGPARGVVGAAPPTGRDSFQHRVGDGARRAP
ncbi:Tyrosine phosphatase family protein [Phycisphaerae bacterium RAS1]|nr:Tyrosine phosphatase family protein [Phycisphaerae bacterium RAS1]